MTALLTIASLGGGDGALPIFRHVAFTVEQGQTIGILGPNGAGKTTLLKTIAGLLPAQQGAIRLDGLELQAQRGHAHARLGLCLVPEGRQIFATMSGAKTSISAPPPRVSRPRNSRLRWKRCWRFFPVWRSGWTRWAGR